MDQIEHIIEAGRKAALARRNHDEAAAKFHTNWAQKACRLEADPVEANRVFCEAYANAR